MKRGSTLILRAVIVLIGLGVLAFLLVEPHFEGRNKDATVFQIYFHDPFLAYAYTGSIAFFVALDQAFRLLGHVARDEVFSPRSVKALRTIRHCAMTLIAFLVGAEAYFNIVERAKGEDIAGGVMMGNLLIFVSVVIGTAAAVFERILQKAVDLKSENDLTV